MNTTRLIVVEDLPNGTSAAKEYQIKPFFEMEDGHTVTELWYLDKTPADADAPRAFQPTFDFNLAPGALRFSHSTFPPFSQIQECANARGLSVKKETFGMHNTTTVDFLVLTKGELDLVTENGTAHLKAGDCVVQKATIHAWINPGNEPAVLVHVMVGANTAHDFQKVEFASPFKPKILMNTKPTVLLLGATGQIGKLIVDQLKNAEVSLRVTSRRKGSAVYLDLDDPRTFAAALQGVKRLFLLTGYSVSMVAQSKTMIDAAKKAGVEHIVHLGVFSREWDCTDPHFSWHQMIEAYIKQSGLKWTFLHPNCFFQNLTGFSLVKNGKFRWYTGKPCGWIALEDVAEAAAKILIDGPEAHHEKDYWFSTEVLTLREMTNILTEVTGKEFLPDLQTPEQFLKDQGNDLDPYINSVAESFRQVEDGRMSYIGTVQDDLPILLGRKGMRFRQWAQLHKQSFTQQENTVWGG